MTDNQAGPLFGVRLPRGIVTYLNGQPIRTEEQAKEALRAMGQTFGEWGEIEAVNDRPWPGALAGVGEHRPDQPQQTLDSAASGALKELVDAAGPVVTEFSAASREERWPAVKRSDLARLEQALSKASRSAVREQEA